MPNHFLAVFAKSPIKPLEEHIKKVFDASLLLLPALLELLKAEACHAYSSGACSRMPITSIQPMK